jgi:hypothetical protein
LIYLQVYTPRRWTSMELAGCMFWNSSTEYWSSGEWKGKFFSSIPEMSAGSSLSNFTLVNNDQEAGPALGIWWPGAGKKWRPH